MSRKARGNMLVLSGVFITVNAVGLLLASSFGSLFFVHNRMQSTADELALDGARKLNEQDRIGQMNNMVARSRAMVFDADASNQAAVSTASHLTDLADQLYMDAKEGAILMEEERVKLRGVSTAEATATVMTRFNEIKNGHGLVLPWLQVSVPVTPVISFGCAASVKSNVGEPSGLGSLDTYDRAQNYIATDGSSLYKDNIDARLSGNPSNLTFKIASLPAPVQNNIAPARAILARDYRSVTSDQLYSTVQVQLQLEVDTTLGATAHSEMQTIGTAEATGGQKMM